MSNAEAYLNGRIWIVTDIKGYTVTMKDFFAVLRQKSKDDVVPSMNLDNILQNMPLTQPDLDLSLGSLVVATKKDVPKGIGIHLANVGPADERGYKQYGAVLLKLRFSKARFDLIDKELGNDVSVDGQFRVISILKKGETDGGKQSG